MKLYYEKYRLLIWIVMGLLLINVLPTLLLKEDYHLYFHVVYPRFTISLLYLTFWLIYYLISRLVYQYLKIKKTLVVITAVVAVLSFQFFAVLFAFSGTDSTTQMRSPTKDRKILIIESRFLSTRKTYYTIDNMLLKEIGSYQEKLNEGNFYEHIWEEEMLVIQYQINDEIRRIEMPY